VALKILYERIGLGPEATEEQAVDRIHALADENKDLRERSDSLQKLLAENHKAVEEAKAAKRKYELAEGRAFLQQAVNDQKIDKEDMEFLLEDYAKDPERVRKQVEKKGYRSILAKQMSISGEAGPPVNGLVELQIRVAERLANDPTKKLSEVEATNQLYREDPGLFERVTEARRQKAGTSKAGER
jgi:hypothetical protein